METQPNLFSPSVYGSYEPPIARGTDPATSHKAAAQQRQSGKLNSGPQAVIDILRRAGRPCTYREIFALGSAEEQATLKEPNTVAKRLSVLLHRGDVKAVGERLCTVGGSEAREWTLATPPESNQQ